MQESMACDSSLLGVPAELTEADKVDYPSDEDSDDEIDFEIEINREYFANHSMRK